MTSILASMPRAVWVLLGAVFVNRVGLVVIPMLSLYLRDRGWTERMALWSGCVYAVGATLSAVPAGLAADRLGRRNLLVASMGLTAAAMLTLGAAERTVTILIAVFFAGLVAEAYRPAVSAMLTDLVRPEHRIPVFALHRTVTNLGHAVGPMLGGLVAAASLYHLLFYIDGFTAALFAIVAAVFLPETRPTPKGPRASPWQVLKDRRFVWFCCGLLPVSAAFFLTLAALPIHLRDHLPGPDGHYVPTGVYAWGVETLPLNDKWRRLASQPSTTFGVLMAVNALLIVTCEYALSLRSRRFQPRAVLMVGVVLTAAGLAAIGAWPTVNGCFAGILFITLGEMLFAPTGLFVVSWMAPPDQRAQYMAMFGITHGLSLILAPLVAGAAMPVVGPEVFWVAAGIFCALAVVAFRQLPRDIRIESEDVAVVPSSR